MRVRISRATGRCGHADDHGRGRRDGKSLREKLGVRSAHAYRALAAAPVIALSLACGNATAHESAPAAPSIITRVARAFRSRQTGLAPPYAGTDSRGIPRYTKRSFTPDERSILRSAYGVVELSHIYVSDSSDEGIVKYDTQVKRCATCYVNSYRLGFTSVRRPGESWDDLERHVRRMKRRDFAPSRLVMTSSLDALDPDIRSEVGDMLADARRAGYRLHVVNSYRSPEQEALLMTEGRGRTHTLTSMHSYGRALDISVGDGSLSHASTRASWISFRRWVIRYRGDDFRILGKADRSWDWQHVELPSARIGFRTIEDAISRGRVCRTFPATTPCDFPPHLPARR